VSSIPVARQVTPHADPAWQTAVAVGERIVSAVLLLALSPLLLAGAAMVWLSSGRTPLIAHKRVGWHGSTLWMLKLRTMWSRDLPPRCSGWIEHVDDPDGPQTKQERDPRVTSGFARFCRRHSLDEIPQLWHVMRGEMSLVGPRPLTAGELQRYYESDAAELLQHKPGLAGLWQISGRGRLTYAQRRALDLELVRRRSPGIYLKILLRTMLEVWRGTNSW
jgi:lipopolysaccharide/colanic/teichoic acid biosynthesis glycosyltransferase